MSSRGSTRGNKPGLRTPVSGYMGHVPGMISLNLHGGVWRDLVMQDPLLHPPQSRPSSARRAFSNAKVNDYLNGSQTARPGGPRPASAQAPTIARIQDSRRLSAEVNGLQWIERGSSPGQPRSEASYKENFIMPRMESNWVPPIAGYGGHVPGYNSGNMHGSSWKVLSIWRPKI